MKYKISLLSLLLLSLPVGCKEREGSRLSDADVRDGEGRIQVIGARKGVVMYRLCSHEDQKRWTERGAQGAYLEDCTQPDGFPDIPTAEYQKLLCDSYQYDAEELAKSTEIRDGAAKLYAMWKKKSDSIQAQLDGAAAGGDVQDVTVFGQDSNSQTVNRDDLLRQLEPTKKQEMDQKKILDEHQAKIDQHNGAKNTCDTLMNDVVLPQKDKQDPTLEIPRIVPMYPTSPEYVHLMAPFKAWKSKSDKQQQAQEAEQDAKKQQSEQNVGNGKPLKTQFKSPLTALTGQFASHCNISKLKSSAYATAEWKSYFDGQCQNKCGETSQKCISWTHISVKTIPGACEVTSEANCQ